MEARWGSAGPGARSGGGATERGSPDRRVNEPRSKLVEGAAGVWNGARRDSSRSPDGLGGHEVGPKHSNPEKSVLQVLVEVGRVLEEGGERGGSVTRVGEEDVSVAQVQPREVDVAGAHLHDRVMGAKENKGVSRDLLESTGHLVGDAGGEGVGRSICSRVGVQTDRGGVLGAWPGRTGVEYAELRRWRERVEVSPSLTEELDHAKLVPSGGLYEEFERHLYHR